DLHLAALEVDLPPGHRGQLRHTDRGAEERLDEGTVTQSVRARWSDRVAKAVELLALEVTDLDVALFGQLERRLGIRDVEVAPARAIAQEAAEPYLIQVPRRRADRPTCLRVTPAG